MIDTEAMAEVTYELARRDFSPSFGGPEIGFREKRVWQEVRRLGTRLWLDTGDVESASALWCSEFEALTTNNTLLNQEIQKGGYDDFVGEAARAIWQAAGSIKERQLILEIGLALNARHGLKLVEMFDAHVSVELHTDLGDDVELELGYPDPELRLVQRSRHPQGSVPLRPGELAGHRGLLVEIHQGDADPPGHLPVSRLGEEHPGR